MSTYTDRIKDLIKFLPEKDISLGYKLLEQRDIKTLKSLVNSAFYKVDKNYTEENPKEEYLKINLDELIILRNIVDNYYSLQVDYDDESINISEDIE